MSVDDLYFASGKFICQLNKSFNWYPVAAWSPNFYVGSHKNSNSKNSNSELSHTYSNNTDLPGRRYGPNEPEVVRFTI